MSHLYDYAWAQIPAMSMAGVPGCVGVMRYVNDTKAITAAERDNLHAAGLGIGLIYEAAATDLEHPERGGGIAERANDLADALGAPRDVPIFFCHDANDAQSPTVTRSYQAIQARSARPAGLYGAEDDLDSALPTYGWQVETWVGGHPRGSVSQHAQLVQLANTKQPLIPGVPKDQYDTNTLVHAFPLWTANGTTGGATTTQEGPQVDVYWRNDTHGPGGAWPYRLLQGEAIIYEAVGAPDPTYGLPLDYVGWYGAQSAELKATIHPILANKTVWDALTAADAALRGHGTGAGGSVDVAAFADAVVVALGKVKISTTIGA